MMGIREPTAEGLHREDECNHHFFGEEGGLPGREKIIHFGGKHQNQGKTWGEGGLRAVIMVII